MYGHWEVIYRWVWYIYLFLQINIYNTAHGLKIAGPMYKYRNPSELIKINYLVNGEDNVSSTLLFTNLWNNIFTWVQKHNS